MQEGTPGKRVEFTRFGRGKEGSVPLKDNHPPPVPAQKKAREGSPSSNRMARITRLQTLLDRYFLKSSLPPKQRKREKLLLTSYNTEGGFLTPEDETLFHKLEEELEPSDDAPIVLVFKQVLNKLKGSKFLFATTVTNK